MQLSDQFDLARRSLRRHVLRTVLTMLGMIVGVASVIVMTSIGLSARHLVAVEIARLGTNLLTVQPTTRTTDALSGSIGSRALSEADGAALTNEVAKVQYAVPVVGGDARLVFGNSNWQTSVIGSSPDYLAARDWQTGAGRNFTLREVASAEKVMLVGKTVEAKLSPQQALLGSIVRVNDAPFRVIGVISPRGFSASGRDLDDVVIAPISTVKSRLIGGYFREHRDAVAYLLVKGSRSDELGDLQAEIERVLRARHRIRSGADDDFAVRDPVAALTASKSTSEALTVMLACIAGVSLLVGGISIMNIMLVSVSERTREIGVRVAVGATRTDIRKQFLAESAAIAGLGGAIGVAIGIAAPLVIGPITGSEVFIDPWVCVGALSFSIVVGLLSGLYPAFRAASLDPMDAIREQ